MKKYILGIMVFVFLSSFIIASSYNPVRDKIYDVYCGENKITILFNDNGIRKYINGEWVKCGGWNFHYNSIGEIEIHFLIDVKKFSGKVDTLGIIKGSVITSKGVFLFMAVRNYVL